MSGLTIRRANADDAAALAFFINGFAKGHAAESHSRSIASMKEAFFGAEPLCHILLAEKNGAAIGFGAWRKTYDLFWSMFGGEGLGLYVVPAHRGFGAAACIIAAMCAEIRKAGGRFLRTSYDSELAGFYERVGVGRAERSCHVSALAFEKLAEAAGGSPREVVRALPDKSLNWIQEHS